MNVKLKGFSLLDNTDNAVTQEITGKIVKETKTTKTVQYWRFGQLHTVVFRLSRSSFESKFSPSYWSKFGQWID